MQLKHTCENCNSSFRISYVETETEDDPHYCPFCGEYIIEDNDTLTDDDDNE